MNVFAFADDRPDCDYALKFLARLGIKASAEGSRVAGYVLSAADANRAQSVVCQSPQFRSGDLRLFLLKHLRKSSRALHVEDVQRLMEWRANLRARDGADD